MVIFHLQFSGVQLASRETKTNPDTLFGNFFNEPVMTINRISIEPVGSTARNLYMYFVLAARKVGMYETLQLNGVPLSQSSVVFKFHRDMQSYRLL